DETKKPAMMGGSLHGKTLRQIEVQRRQLPLHEGLTRMKSLLIWPAALRRKPSGSNEAASTTSK
ncbi:hypothetical protein, partial [Xanthomonas citri]|uniref:hypothetical protein n=1 Tax=Xanthomonas citri TaxID=346 RepID=UPI001CC15DAD